MADRKIPLILSVKAENWRMHDASSQQSDAEFKHVRLRALERDNYTCQACGFRNPTWQEVHHVDDNHANNELSNLATLCPFCHMVQHIGLAGYSGEAVLAFIPEISQADLHHLVRTILYGKDWANTAAKGRNADIDTIRTSREVREAAEALEADLRARVVESERVLGTSSPLELANILQRVANDRPESYARRGDFLLGIRLLPLGTRRDESGDVMAKMIASWSQTGGAYAGFNPRSWLGMCKAARINMR